MEQKNVIAYVDDDLDDIGFLQDAIAVKISHQLVAFSRASVLLAYLNDNWKDVCLVVLDMNIPEMSGLDALAVIRESHVYRHLPAVIFSTGVNTSQAEKVAALRAQIMKKPSSIVEWEAVAESFTAICLHNQPKGQLV